MALNNPNKTATATTAAAFEEMPEDQVTTTTATQASAADAAAAVPSESASSKIDAVLDAAPEADKPAEAAAEALSQSTAVAVSEKPASALALANPKPKIDRAAMIEEANYLATLKDALPVTWEDFSTVNATQGEFGQKGDGGKSLGKHITLRLVSHQDLFVSSPHDMDAQGEDLVKYSDDGVVAHDGTLITEHQAELLEKGFTNAGVDHKLVLVGELVSCQGEQGLELVGDLLQVVLPDTGRRAFMSHTKLSGYHIMNGRLTQEAAEYVKLTATQAGAGNKKYTKVNVGYADGYGANKPGN